jgi:hypothetical protein
VYENLKKYDKAKMTAYDVFKKECEGAFSIAENAELYS